MRTVQAGILAAMIGAAAAAAVAEEGPTTRPKPVVEVAFVLDTTGSMAGLIEGAKQKIWSIANQIMTGTPRPTVRFGLVAYRDKGDDYVTKAFPLSANIDQIYEELMKFQAAGGGDEPEHVNRALAEAVEKMGWTPDDKALKIIFLVGDCPPHLDYDDGYDYRKSAREAIAKGIVVNTIRCGGNAQTEKVWREIADLAEGRSVSIDQSGGVQTVPTPMDARLAELNRALGETVVGYGSAGERAATEGRHLRLGRAMAEPSAPAGAAADRAEFKARSGRMDEADLLDALRDKKVTLDSVKDEELPNHVRKMSKDERRKYLGDLEKKRQTVLAEVRDLAEKRRAFIKAELEKRASKGDAFDKQVLKMLRDQAAKHDLTY